MIDDATVVLATGSGPGPLPWTPGTSGPLLGLPLAGWTLRPPMRWQVCLGAALATVAVPIRHIAAARPGGGDALTIVVDAFFALPLAVLGIGQAHRTLHLGIALVPFRMVDTSSSRRPSTSAS